MEKEIQIYMQQKGFEDVKAFYDVPCGIYFVEAV